MSDLEDACSASITRMFDGHPTSFTTTDRLNLARWSLKTAMVFDTVVGRKNRIFPESLGSALRERTDDTPPITIFLSRISPGKMLLNTSTRLPEKFHALPSASLETPICRLVMGQLMIHVIALIATPDVAGLRGTLDDPDTLIGLWPMRDNEPVANWPPTRLLDEDQMLTIEPINRDN